MTEVRYVNYRRTDPYGFSRSSANEALPLEKGIEIMGVELLHHYPLHCQQTRHAFN
jgi:hypothetical protein